MHGVAKNFFSKKLLAEDRLLQFFDDIKYIRN